MEIFVTKQDDVTTARLVGRLDTQASQEMNSVFTELQESAGETVVLDCKEMDYISSSGLRLFLSLRKSASVKGGRVIVRDITSDIRNVFMMTGFLNLFEIE